MQGLTHTYVLPGDANWSATLTNNNNVTVGKFTYLSDGSVVNATIVTDPAVPIVGNSYSSRTTFVFTKYGIGFCELTYANGSKNSFLCFVSFLDVAEKLAVDETLSMVSSNERVGRAWVRVLSGFCEVFDYNALTALSKVLVDDAFYVYVSGGGEGVVERGSLQGDIRTIKSPYGQEFSYYQTKSTSADSVVDEDPLTLLNRMVCEALVLSGIVGPETYSPILIVDMHQPPEDSFWGGECVQIEGSVYRECCLGGCSPWIIY